MEIFLAGYSSQALPIWPVGGLQPVAESLRSPHDLAASCGASLFPNPSSAAVEPTAALLSRWPMRGLSRRNFQARRVLKVLEQWGFRSLRSAQDAGCGISGTECQACDELMKIYN